ncbi:4997_t:CDS:2 [Acaulospora colombiana]|uniref:4997_t:CDS:1 n=1 Tax=Acaulospora colombiana TaxID=27376 RepID=A0ACA9LJ11_9GLOM|nr:4997_t:CDS:2 [Acaulospora colombiana]
MNFSFTDRLTELNNARDRSLITDEEYSMLRGRLFESFVAGPPTSSNPAPPPSQQQYLSPPLSPQQLSSSPPSSSPQQLSLPPPRHFSLPPHQNSTTSPPSSMSITHSNETISSSSPAPIIRSNKSSSSLPRRIRSSNNNTNDPSSGSNIISTLFNVVSPRKSRSNNVLSLFPTSTNNISHGNEITHPSNNRFATASDNVEVSTISNDIRSISEELQPLSISETIPETRRLPEIAETENQHPSASVQIAITNSPNVTPIDSSDVAQSPPPRRSLATTRPSSMICTNSEHVSFEINRNDSVGENDVNEGQQSPSSPRQPHVNAATLARRHRRALSWGFNSSVFGNNSSDRNNRSHGDNRNGEGAANERNENNNGNNVNNESASTNPTTIAGNPESNYIFNETDQFEQLVPELPPPPYTPPESSQTRGRRRPSAFFIKPKTSAELRKELQKLIEQSKKEANSLKIEEARLRMRLNSKPEELDRVKRKIRESNEKYQRKIETVNNKLRQISARENNVDGGGGRN